MYLWIFLLPTFPTTSFFPIFQNSSKIFKWVPPTKYPLKNCWQSTYVLDFSRIARWFWPLKGYMTELLWNGIADGAMKASYCSKDWRGLKMRFFDSNYGMGMKSDQSNWMVSAESVIWYCCVSSTDVDNYRTTCINNLTCRSYSLRRKILFRKPTCNLYVIFFTVYSILKLITGFHW